MKLKTYESCRELI